MELARYEYIQRRENVMPSVTAAPARPTWPWDWVWPPASEGCPVGFTTAAALVHEMMEARDERRLLNLQRQLSRLNLLIIDELGFVPLSRTGAELLFEVFSQRYERGSILVTTNLPLTSGPESSARSASPARCWTGCTHHVHILEMNGDSYRLKRSRENAAAQAPDESDNHKSCQKPSSLTRPACCQPASVTLLPNNWRGHLRWPMTSLVYTFAPPHWYVLSTPLTFSPLEEPPSPSAGRLQGPFQRFSCSFHHRSLYRHF